MRNIISRRTILALALILLPFIFTRMEGPMTAIAEAYTWFRPTAFLSPLMTLGVFGLFGAGLYLLSLGSINCSFRIKALPLALAGIILIYGALYVLAVWQGSNAVSLLSKADILNLFYDKGHNPYFDLGLHMLYTAMGFLAFMGLYGRNE